jgi:hypothetical protein
MQSPKLVMQADNQLVAAIHIETSSGVEPGHTQEELLTS